MAEPATTPAKKKPNRVAAKRNDAIIQTLVKSVRDVSLNELSVFPGNPRRGDVKAIMESLRTTGQYRPIVVQKSTGHVLTGNHTFLAIRKLGWTKCSVCYVDVDDRAAKRIVAADNRTAELGGYDDQALAKLLSDIGAAEGTGFTAEEFDDLVGSIGSDMAGDVSVPEFDTDEVELPSIEPRRPRVEDVQFGDENENTQPELEQSPREQMKKKEEAEGPDPLLKAAEKFRGALQLSDDFMPPLARDNFGFPVLRDDMLATADDMRNIVPHLRTWIGKMGNDDPIVPERWWYYNFGVDNTASMHDLSQVILSFHCYDKYFEKWWDIPTKLTTKALNSGIKYAVMPDYTPEHEMGQTMCQWQAFRSRWMGRFFQDAGLKLIPTVTWPDNMPGYLSDCLLKTMPEQVPVLDLQMQTFDPSNAEGGVKEIAGLVQTVLNTLQPEMLIWYSGWPGKKMLDDYVDTDSIEVVHLLNRQQIISDHAKKNGKRKMKTTL